LLLSETTGQSTTTGYAHLSTTSYGYDAVNRQNQVIQGYGQPEQTTATMIFDKAGNLLSETDGQSSTTTYAHVSTTSYAYDAMNRQSKVISGYGTAVASTATMIYDLAGNLLSETTGQSTTTAYAHVETVTYQYDALNRQTEEIGAYGISGQQSTSTTAYEKAGNVLSTTDPNGNVTSYAYDALNRQTQVIQGYGSSVASTATMIYDAAGNLLSETTGQSTTTAYAHQETVSYAYDSLNRQTEVIQGLGQPEQTTATMLYDAAGNLLSETTGQSGTATYAHQATTSYGYDALNRQSTEIDAYGAGATQRTVTTVYDAAGNVQARIDALNNATTMTYDALNREVTVKDPLGHVGTTVYDAAGNVINTIDANGNTSTFAFDALNRQTTATDPRGGVTTTTFDAQGNQLTLTDSDGNTTTMAYDSLNRLTQQTDPLNHSATFVYDAGSRLTSTTDRDGRVRNFTYDALNRETGQTWVVSGSTVNTQTFTFDAQGNQLTAADKNGTYTMAYDALNRTTSEQEPFGQTLTFTFDAASNRYVVQDSLGGTTTSTYDALNRLTERQFGGSGQTPLHASLTWTARDQLSTITRYDDQAGTLAGTSTYQYDAAMRLTNLQHTDSGGNNIGSYVYNYDPGNRLTSETDNGTTTSYQYDAGNELTQAGSATYGYDANGNRTNTGYTTGAGNELTNDGTWTYTYDNEGNLTKKSKGSNAETWTYGYDSLNHLVSAKDAATDGGTTLTLVTYVYDVLGNRIEEDAWTQSGGTTTVSRYAYDGLNVWADLNGSNALVMRRLYLDGVDQPFARIDSGGTAAWYLPDHLGSERDIENYAGTTALDQVTYDAYGNITNETNTANGDRYKYTAREFDTYTGLQFNRGRDYNPSTGRWDEQDPLGFDAGDSNLYRYVENAPTIITDPNGLDAPAPWWEYYVGVQYPEVYFPIRAGQLLLLNIESMQLQGKRKQLPLSQEEQLVKNEIKPDGFPNLGKLGKDWWVIAYSTPRDKPGSYNCYAWSLDDTSQIIVPEGNLEQATFTPLYEKKGYSLQTGPLDFSLKAGYQKVVLYGKKGDNGKTGIMHAALQQPNGTWTSKLGSLPLIVHDTPERLSGPAYGEPVAVYERKNDAFK
jgi:RHS repeat-associated protein